MIQIPPAIYNHPYSGHLTEWIYRAPKVDDFCRSVGAKGEGQIIGCQFFIGERCFIVLSQHAVKALRQHETAHCNGWKHDNS